MSYLIDTNVISELRRSRPSSAVERWFSQRDGRLLYISVLTIGELQKGINKTQDPQRRQNLMDWLESDVRRFFAGRILPVDESIAVHWGQLVGTAAGPKPVIDSLLAATARFHGLCLVTRNVSDFDYPGLEVFNPWNTL